MFSFFRNIEKPDFLIIGAQKSGTTALFNFICQHPQFSPPTKKEIHFFDLYYEKKLKWYLKKFPKKKKII